MKIKMRTRMAGPDGVVQIGEITDVDEEVARRLVGHDPPYADYAGPIDDPIASEPVEPPDEPGPVEIRVEVPPETAEAPPVQAAQKPTRKKAKRRKKAKK